jgi:hypothetical protein
MPSIVEVTWDKRGLASLDPGPMKRAILRALRKAGSTALRDMRSEANKRIKARKAIKPSYIARAITLRRPSGTDIGSMSWEVRLSGKPVPLVAYPHRAVAGKRAAVARTRKGQFKAGSGSSGGSGGVRVEVNRGKQTLIKGAFITSLTSGHVGIFRRRGKGRLPIDEMLGSRPVDALLHKGESEAVVARGAKSLAATYERVLPLELGKGK